MDLISLLSVLFAFWLGYTVHKVKTMVDNQQLIDEIKNNIEENLAKVVEVESERIGEVYHIRKFDTKEFLAQGPTMVAAGEAALDRLPKDCQIRIVNVIN